MRTFNLKEKHFRPKNGRVVSDHEHHDVVTTAHLENRLETDQAKKKKEHVMPGSISVSGLYLLLCGKKGIKRTLLSLSDNKNERLSFREDGGLT